MATNQSQAITANMNASATTNIQAENNCMMQPGNERVLSPTTKFSKSLGGTAEINQGQVTEKKAHGSVEFGTDPDDGDHAQVPHHGDCIDGEENQEQGNLEVGIF